METLEPDTVQKLQDTLGIHKIQLLYEGGDSEGVWATFPTEADKASYYEETQGVAYKAVLLNEPLGWQGRKWGDVITATTQGSGRPVARWQDNPTTQEELRAERDELRSECEEHRAWRCVDATLVEQREEIERLKSNHLHQFNEVMRLRAELAVVRDERDQLRAERDGVVVQVYNQIDLMKVVRDERDAACRKNQENHARIRALETELESRAPTEEAKRHPKVGDWVRRTEEYRRNANTVGVSEIGKVSQIEVQIEIEVDLANGEAAWWYPKNCEPCDPPAEPAKRSHPVKVGEWVRRLVPSPACDVGIVAKVVHVDDDTSEIEYDVRRIDGQIGVWFAKNCEPCDPPTADHDTPEGKASAEAVIRDSRKTGDPKPGVAKVTEETTDEPIREEDWVEIVSATYLTLNGDIGKKGSVIEIDADSIAHIGTPADKQMIFASIHDLRRSPHPVKVGDVVRVTGHTLCLKESVGSIGLVESTGVGPLGPWVKMCFAVEDVTKVAP